MHSARPAYATTPTPLPKVLVPIDVYSTLSNVAYNGEVDVMWKTCFWSTQVLTWLVLPFFQVYADAGDFTVGARCLTSLKVRTAKRRRLAVQPTDTRA